MFTGSTTADKADASNPCRGRLRVLVNDRAKGARVDIWEGDAQAILSTWGSWPRRAQPVAPCRNGDGIYMQEHESHKAKNRRVDGSEQDHSLSTVSGA
jgi:hypothetical protein